MKKFYKFYLLTFILLTDFMMYAQPGDDTGGGGLEGDDPPPAPINSQLILLTILGILFVFNFYRQKSKQA